MLGEADIQQNSSTEVGITLQKLMQQYSPELQNSLSIIFWITELITDINVEEEEKSGHLSCLYLGAYILSCKCVNIDHFTHCLLFK